MFIPQYSAFNPPSRKHMLLFDEHYNTTLTFTAPTYNNHKTTILATSTSLSTRFPLLIHSLHRLGLMLGLLTQAQRNSGV